MFQRLTRRIGLGSLPALFRYSSTTRPASETPPAAGSAGSSPDVARIVAALEKDSTTLEQVLSRMNPESRRRLVIAGGAIEWFGKEKIDQEVAAADFDKDQFISPKDFDHWFHSALSRYRPGERLGLPDAATNNVAVPIATLALIALEAGLPFVGFGFLDNATMILAGDMIDQTIGFYFHCSVMASAAMGNVISGMMGMQVHGLVERSVRRLNLPVPTLTEEQRNSQRVFMAGHVGGTVGIACGLILGMLPLLMISDQDEKLEHRIFGTLDTDHDGFISACELMMGLQQAGLNVDIETAKRMINEYSKNERLSLEQFRQLSRALKA